MIIDIHIHAFPDKVAARAIEALEAIYGVKAYSDGTVADLLAQMAQSGVDVSVIQSVSTEPRQVISINTWVSSLPQILKETDGASERRVIGFGTIHPKFEGYREEIQRMKELGIKGVKFQPSFQEFYPDDEKMFPVYEEIIEAGLIILFHAGDEIRPAQVIYSTPQRLARLLDVMQDVISEHNYRTAIGNQPAIKFIAAHLGGYKLWDDVEKYLLGRDIYLDASYVLGYMDTDRAIRIMRSHGMERILFGSDFPFADQRESVQKILQLDITSEEKGKILGINAAQLLMLG